MPVTIPALTPFGMEVVPDTRRDWIRWREQVLKVRVLLRRKAESSPAFRAQLLELAAQDAAFFLCIYGSILEPRTIVDTTLDNDGNEMSFTRPRGWYPWVPYHYQVELIRTMEDTLATEEDTSGKGDLVIEKSRDMGATWTMCAYVAHDWLFGENVYVGLFSRKEEYVDSDNPNSMFFKIEALSGIYRKIQDTCYAPGTIFHGIPVKIPDYLRPVGFDERIHDHKLNLIHPTKSNQIFGESTTSKSGIASRTNYNIIDEGAKIAPLLDMWSGQSAVTSHRIVLSSADRREGDGMYTLVEDARRATRDPGIDGPRLVTLHWRRNPMFDDAWYERQKARHANDPHGFAREYDIAWNAGIADWVYPHARELSPSYAPYDATLGQVWCTIDPGLADPSAMAWIQSEPGTPFYRVVESLVIRNPNAEYLAPLLMGFPPGHHVREMYHEASEQEILDFTWKLRQTGHAVEFVGDPYGRNSGGAGKETFYDALLRRSRELNRQYPERAPMELRVKCKFDEGARFHPARKESLSTLLPLLKIHKSPRCLYVLDALQRNRYRPSDDGRMVMNEANTPLHDWTSHIVTALEYFAVLVAIRRSLGVSNAKPKKVSRAPSRVARRTVSRTGRAA